MYLNSSSSAQSRIGQVSSSNNVATSSSTFLSSIRSNTSLSASSSSLSSSSSSLNISTNDGSLDQPSQRKKSIHEDIRERLEKIFKDHYDHQHSSSSSSSSNNSSTIDRKLLLSSDRIISHFPDLGDQYASLFKEILRSMAILQNGQWIRRL